MNYRMTKVSQLTRGKFKCLLAILVLAGCGPTDFGPPPRRQEVRELTWSPDGTQLAFTYQNNSPSNQNYIVYTMREDGTQLKKLYEFNSKYAPFRLFQWVDSSAMVIDNSTQIGELDAQGLIHPLFKSGPEYSEPGNYSGVCSFQGGRYLALHRAGALPLWVNRQEVGMARLVAFNSPNPFLGIHAHLNELRCASQSQRVYLSSSTFVGKELTESHIFATGVLDPESGQFQSIQTFEPLKQLPQREQWPIEYRPLGWKDADTFVYAFVSNSKPIAVYDYHVPSTTTQTNTDIKVLGTFSPNLQKVATVTALDTKHYIAISRSDGTGLKRVLQIETLPKGNLPL